LNKCLPVSLIATKKQRVIDHLKCLSSYSRNRLEQRGSPCDPDTHTVLCIAVVCSFVEGKVCIVVLGNVMIKVSLNSPWND